MNINEHKERIIRAIKDVQQHKQYELEAIIRTNINHKISLEDFNNVISSVKGIPNIKLQSDGETLDIFLAEDKDNLRYTVYGNKEINQYCKTNNLADLRDGTYTLINKKSISKIDINNYNVRINLKDEKPLNIDIEVFNDWHKESKIFRYKRRFSFITDDKLFSFDLSVVKSSKKKIIKLPTILKKKKEVSVGMKKYVIKPENIQDFNDWWNSLKPTEEVQIEGKKIEEFIPSKTLQNSNTLHNPIEYEIELEYLGNKFDYKDKYENILNKLLANLSIILQSIQKNYFIISQKEKSDFRDTYKELMKGLRFMAPQPTTLEIKHVARKNYADYPSILNIRRNYCVTEKADGERNLLVVLKNDSCYMINRKNEIKSLACKLKGMGNSIFDCEYIIKDIDNKNIILVAVFDIYFHKSTDLRNRIFNRSDEEKIVNKIEKSRYEIINEIFQTIDLQKSDDNPLMLTKKQFYFGDVVDYDSEIDKDIIRLEIELGKTNHDSDSYLNLKNYINIRKSDTKLFSNTETVYNKDYIYKIDGLIFTPINLKVGENYDSRKFKHDGRWLSCFKWKPPEENTIDFKILYKKDPEDDSKDEVRYVSINDEAIPYKIAILNVGYNPEIHTKINSCRVLNEELTFEEKYTGVPFQPTNPYIKNIELAYIPLLNGTPYCESKDIIRDGNIVEFRYNPKKEVGFCWEPMRVRNVNNPNDFMTATGNWRTLHNPITKSMIISGNVDDIQDEVYYINIKDRKNLPTKPMADFHSYVKKQLIISNCKNQKKLLDMGVGRCGDLNHWLDTKLEYIVGIDINRDNLENSNNGGCNRILGNMSTNKSRLLKNTLLIWGNVSNAIANGDAANDDLNKYYLDVLYGNIEKEVINNSKLLRFYNMGSNKFDVISCQFSFHYYFENDLKLHRFLKNVSDNLQKGKFFIGTCLDGSTVFNKLINVDKLIGYTDNEILWKIIKKYKQTEFRNDGTSIGYPIDVFVNSIGKTTTEWLVNFDYIKDYAPKFNLKLIKLTKFDELYETFTKDKQNYGNAKNMNDQLKSFSFMFTQFVFVKTE